MRNWRGPCTLATKRFRSCNASFRWRAEGNPAEHPVLESTSTMQRAGSTLKKIFADTLRPVGDDAPLLAWPLACGSQIADKTSAVSYGDGGLTVRGPGRTGR